MQTRFPALRIAREALQAGGGASSVLNAANEVAVAAFLGRQIRFTDIAAICEQVLERTAGRPDRAAGPGPGARCRGQAPRGRRGRRAPQEHDRLTLTTRTPDQTHHGNPGSDTALRLLVPGAADRARVRPRIRPLHRRALVRRAGRGVLDRLRPGAVRPDRQARHALEVQRHPARRLRQDVRPGRQSAGGRGRQGDDRRKIARSPSTTRACGGAWRSSPPARSPTTCSRR